MKRFIVISSVVVSGLALLVLAVIVASDQTRVSERQRQVREEFSWTYQILSQDRQVDRLHEHLKARLYYWGMFMPDDALRRFERVDFGPVDEYLLGRCVAAPIHADSPNEHRRVMLKKLTK